MKTNWQKLATIMTIVVLVITGIFSIAVFAVSLQSDVEINNNQMLEFDEKLKSNSDNINYNNKRIVITETHYEHIKESLDRIEDKMETK